MFVERAGHDFHGFIGVATEVRDFLGAFIDQKNDHMGIRMIRRDGVRDLLKQNGLAGPRRCDDQRTLAKAQRRDQIDHSGFEWFCSGLQNHTLVGMQRREVLEGRQVVELLWRSTVDLLDSEHRKVRLRLLGWPDETLDDLTTTQTESSDLRRTDVHVVR